MVEVIYILKTILKYDYIRKKETSMRKLRL